MKRAVALVAVVLFGALSTSLAQQAAEVYSQMVEIMRIEQSECPPSVKTFQLAVCGDYPFPDSTFKVEWDIALRETFPHLSSASLGWNQEELGQVNVYMTGSDLYTVVVDDRFVQLLFMRLP